MPAPRKKAPRRKTSVRRDASITELRFHIGSIQQENKFRTEQHERLIAKWDGFADAMTKAIGELQRQFVTHEERYTFLKESLQETKTTVANIEQDNKNLEKAIVDKVEKTIETALSPMTESLSSLNQRVGVLERWRWLITGGAITLGFVLGLIFQFSEFLTFIKSLL